MLTDLPPEVAADLGEPEQDPVVALHDVQEESGDEEGVVDALTLDRRSARDLGVDLDPVDEDDRQLD